MGSLNTHVVHLTTRIALWSLVALRCLVPIPHLLHLLILHRGVGSSLLGAVVGIVTNLPTNVVAIARGSAGCTRLHGRSAESAGAVVAGTGTAAAGHNPLSGPLDGTELPAVR
jgi:hypothetical protein